MYVILIEGNFKVHYPSEEYELGWLRRFESQATSLHNVGSTIDQHSYCSSTKLCAGKPW